MARKNQRVSRSAKRGSAKISSKGGRGSSRFSGRKPKSAVAKKKAKAAQAGGEVKRALEAMNWSHAFLDKLISGVPANKVTWQASPADNHVVWTLGHLAATYSWCAGMIDGKKHEMPAEFDKAFGYKSVPVNDPSAYPPLDTVRRHYDAAYQRLVEAVSNMNESDGHSPTIGDAGDFARTKLDVVWRVVWHDGWHQGQVSTLRRGMGLPGVM